MQGGGVLGETAGLGRVAVVEAEPKASAVLVRHLEVEGFDVVETRAGANVVHSVLEQAPDVVILDIGLLGADGLDVLRLLRRSSDVAVILLGTGIEESQRILGLDLGADDVVAKPISAAEVAARVRAVLRRRRPREGGGLRFGALLIDRRARLVWVDEQAVELTHREFDLIAFLASAPEQVFSREQLLAQVWGSSSDWQRAATVTEHVRRLRAKLGGAGPAPWIRTVRGVGYAFSAPATRPGAAAGTSG